ncbi:FAD-dependent oxidoreductase [Flavobacteriaceae bacterium R38]|nr:FAD-dependent oxidoreductase [Flavobacteriaceae bacterium R38]
MNLSYWEIKQWLDNVDFTIVGSGIVGLNCALSLRKKYPKSKILILEKGILPQGASTKNAGFACFGSISELLHDLKTHSEEVVFNLVKNRWEGLLRLREILGDKALDYKPYGGYEVFLEEDSALYEECKEEREYLNQFLKPLFKKEVFSITENKFGFKRVNQNYILNNFEGQLDTGKMMEALLKKCIVENIRILNATNVLSFEEMSSGVLIKTTHFEMESRKLFIATNGFTSTLFNADVKPARAQVLITKPIKNLHIKGTFHLDKGYYYFRNIDNRILFGGGRNLDKEGETTTSFGETEHIQKTLKALLSSVILPNTPFEIEHKWSGIMGVSDIKKPIVDVVSNHVFCGVRLGGMGVAIGSLIGQELASLAD